MTGEKWGIGDEIKDRVQEWLDITFGWEQVYGHLRPLRRSVEQRRNARAERRIDALIQGMEFGDAPDAEPSGENLLPPAE